MTSSRALRRVSAATAAAALGLAGAALAVQPAAAATFTVSNTEDAGPGSLRQAILDTNGAPGADTIEFDASGTITLQSPLSITEAVTITGPGADVLTITRAGSFDLLTFAHGTDFSVSGVAFVAGAAVDDTGRAIDAAAGGSISLSEVSFAGFSAGNSSGGAVHALAQGSFSATDVVATDNTAREWGGAFYINAGEDVTITGLTASGNSAGEGGVVFVDTFPLLPFLGDLLIADSTFEGNQAQSGGAGSGGAVYVAEMVGEASVVRSVFSGNTAEDSGGGAHFFNPSQVNVTASLFENNTASYGGGVGGSVADADRGRYSFSETTFVGNEAVFGGGVYLSTIAPGSEPAVSIDSSTFYGNILAPALNNDSAGVSVFLFLGRGSDARVVNSTFDEASDLTPAPGAIAVLERSTEETAPSKVEVLHSTVVGPSAILQLRTGAPEDPEAGIVLASHDILVSNTDADALSAANVINAVSAPLGPDAAPLELSEAAPAAGPALSEVGYTLEWSVVSTTVDPSFVTQGAGNQLETDPQLAALADNGGATLTRLPADTSPAVNAGDPAVEGAPAVDQRGSARVVATIDVGAVELPTGAEVPVPVPAPELAATGGTVDWALLLGAAGVLLLGAAGLVIARTRNA